MLRETGLGGQVQVGVPLPVDEAKPLRSPGVKSPPGAEEDPLDAFLRPSQREARGRLIEIEGGLSSGRTALAYRMVAGATTRGELVGWVDLPNALDPRSLRRAGVDLQGLLWVRPTQTQAALRAAELLLRTGFAVVVVDLEGAARRTLERLGPAVWSRLLRAVREARAIMVLLGTNRSSSSFAALGLYTERSRALFDGGLFEGLETSAMIGRNRTGPTGTAYPLRISHRPAPE
jgi:hypothetical protein